MPEVLHQFVIEAAPDVVWPFFATPSGLDKWWTERAEGETAPDAVWELFFTPEYDWRARVTRCEKDTAFELSMLEAMDDWIGTRVGVEICGGGGRTVIDFYHRGWAANTDHFRISSFCWATYLRLLKRHIEHGEFTMYGQRDYV